MVRLRFLSFIWYLIRSIMFWGAIFFVLVPRGKGESYFFDKYFFAQNDMNRINIWFGLLLDRINYGTFEVFSGHLVLNSVHNISNRGMHGTTLRLCIILFPVQCMGKTFRSRN